MKLSIVLLSCLVVIAVLLAAAAEAAAAEWCCTPSMKLKTYNVRRDDVTGHSSSVVDNVEACQARCDEYDDCESIEYNPTGFDEGGRNCHLNTVVAADADADTIVTDDTPWEYCERAIPQNCTFPFAYRGQEFTECTAFDIPSGRSFCATVSDFDHVPRPNENFLYCECSASIYV